IVSVQILHGRDVLADAGGQDVPHEAAETVGHVGQHGGGPENGEPGPVGCLPPLEGHSLGLGPRNGVGKARVGAERCVLGGRHRTYDASVTEEGPSGNPFEQLPIFGDLAKLFSGQGPVSWDVARQIAVLLATEGQPEANVDPIVRMRYEELGRVAELQVAEATGLATAPGGGVVRIVTVGRGTWAQRGLEAYRPLLERLAGA